jgi:hypothetical protein
MKCLGSVAARIINELKGVNRLPRRSLSMIRKSGNRFSENIMLKQGD